MEIRSSFWTLLLVLGLAAGFGGCSEDDDDNPTGPGDNNNGDTVQLDATDGGSWTHYNLSDGETTDANSDWDIAFRRFEVKLNGGASGDAGVRAADLAAMGHEHGMDFDAVTSMPMLNEEDWSSDAMDPVFDGWYSYDPSDHSVSPTGRVYAMRDASGSGYAKIRVTDVTAAGMGQIGSVTLEFVHDPDGTDLSGPSETVTLNDDDSDNVLIFSFPTATADGVWDLRFNGFDAQINGGVSGNGSAGVFPAYDDPAYSDWDALTTAPPDMGAGYEQDSMSSAMTDWYSYNGQTHEVVSKGHVYLLDTGDATWKFEITNYYKVIEGSPVSGWISFRYDEL